MWWNRVRPREFCASLHIVRTSTNAVVVAVVLALVVVLLLVERERERDAHALLWVKLLFDLIICWWDDYYMALWGRKCLGATASHNCCGYWPVMRGLSAPARYATTDPSVVSSFSSLAIIPSELTCMTHNSPKTIFSLCCIICEL